MAKQENTRIASEIIIKRILMKCKKRIRKNTSTEEDNQDDDNIVDITLSSDGKIKNVEDFDHDDDESNPD